MTARKYMMVLAAGLALTLLTGCPFGSDRLSNDGGTSLPQLLAKVTAIQNGTGCYTDLNPDDFQLLFDTLASVAQVQMDPLSDTTANALVDTLVANGICTNEDYAELAEKLADDPESLVIPASVTDEVLAELQAIGQALASADLSSLSGAIGL